jgi:Rod binding domain-containing protein
LSFVKATHSRIVDLKTQTPSPSQEVSETEGEKKLKEVASLYEKEFTRQLVKAMRATVPKSSLVTENQAEKIFSEQLFDHYGDLMVDKGSQRFSQHIYQNLLDRFGNQLGIPNKNTNNTTNNSINNTTNNIAHSGINNTSSNTSNTSNTIHSAINSNTKKIENLKNIESVKKIESLDQKNEDRRIQLERFFSSFPQVLKREHEGGFEYRIRWEEQTKESYSEGLHSKNSQSKESQNKNSQTQDSYPQKLYLKDSQSSQQNLVTPLGGKILASRSFGENKGVFISLDHGHQIVSEIKFLGQPQVEVGQVLEPGQSLGRLDSSGREYLWLLKKQP